MPVGGSPARSVRFISRIQAGSLIECPLSDVDVGQLVDGCKVPFYQFPHSLYGQPLVESVRAVRRGIPHDLHSESWIAPVSVYHEQHAVGNGRVVPP